MVRRFGPVLAAVLVTAVVLPLLGLPDARAAGEGECYEIRTVMKRTSEGTAETVTSSVAFVPCPPGAQPAPDTPAEQADAVTQRALARTQSFVDWLNRHDARGLIGEVGWPGDPKNPDHAHSDDRWNAVARDWYRLADDAGLWVTVWGSSEWFGHYPLAPYKANPAGPLNVVAPQAAVLEAAPPGQHLRGVNVAGAEFATPNSEPTSSFSNRNPGEYGKAYQYPSRETFEFLAGRGVEVVRLPLRWERLQRDFQARWDADEKQRLIDTVNAAGAAGLKVILDVHNYGAYYRDQGDGKGTRRNVGEPVVRDAFAQLWWGISLTFSSNPHVIGYGLMNEPVDVTGGAKGWESASQAAVKSIRDRGDKKRIFVSSYFWGGVEAFAQHHAGGPWINDPVVNTWYEGHAYWDDDQSGTYTRSYDDEAARAKAQGHGA